MADDQPVEGEGGTMTEVPEVTFQTTTHESETPTMTTTDPTITPEQRNHLRAPFASSAIRWLPIASMVGGKQQFLPYISASLVFERLSDVDPAWSLVSVEPEARTDDDPLGAKHGYPHRATLRVLGVERSGRGVAGRTEPAKSAESDAIKRAALAFEVGAYLRAFDTVFLPENVNGAAAFKSKNGKFSYLTAHGKAQLAAHYDRVLKHAQFRDRYGEPIEYGDVAALEGDTLTDDEAASASDQAGPDVSDAELEVLVLLSKFNGRDTPEDVVRDTLTKYPFDKCLARVLTSVKSNLLLDAEPADEFKRLAVAASQEDADALRELGDRLVAAQKAVSGGDGQQVLA